MGGDEWCWGTSQYHTLWRQEGGDFIMKSANPTHIHLNFNIKKVKTWSISSMHYWASFDPDLALMYHIAF